MTEYPYMISNNKIRPIITKIQQAARPTKFTLDFLRSLGFTSTNDRAFIPLIKKLGFLMEDGTPTTLYDQLKDSTSTAKILAAQIKTLYSDLYTINTEKSINIWEQTRSAPISLSKTPIYTFA